MLTLLLLLAAGCRPAPMGGPVPSRQMIVCGTAECRAGADVEVTYLGVAGFLIQAGDRALLTAPHFTNPPLPLVAGRLLWREPTIEPNRPLIRSLLPAEARRASTILVGHGHYDHLLDVPFIADSLATESVIYGGPSIRNMLMGDAALRTRLVAIDSAEAGSVERSGRWFMARDSGFRFMALKSSHAPAYLGWPRRVDYAPGTVDTALHSLPERATEWKAGETYAYLIDVLDAAGRTVFRIYYQDAASDAPLGFPPASIGGRRVDLAILCVPNARNARPRAPDALIQALNPRYVIAGHWEWFFRPQTERVRRSPSSDFRELAASLQRHLPADADWSTPQPMDRYRFRAAP